MNHAQRVLQARMAAHTRWANEPDRKAATAAARQGLQDRFERQVDPEGILSPAERSIRAGHARKAYMLSISLKAAQKRSRKISASSHQEGALATPPRSRERSAIQGADTPGLAETRLGSDVPNRIVAAGSVISRKKPTNRGGNP